MSVFHKEKKASRTLFSIDLYTGRYGIIRYLLWEFSQCLRIWAPGVFIYILTKMKTYTKVCRLCVLSNVSWHAKVFVPHLDFMSVLTFNSSTVAASTNPPFFHSVILRVSTKQMPFFLKTLDRNSPISGTLDLSGLCWDLCFCWKTQK